VGRERAQCVLVEIGERTGRLRHGISPFGAKRDSGTAAGKARAPRATGADCHRLPRETGRRFRPARDHIPNAVSVPLDELRRRAHGGAGSHLARYFPHFDPLVPDRRYA